MELFPSRDPSEYSGNGCLNHVDVHTSRIQRQNILDHSSLHEEFSQEHQITVLEGRLNFSCSFLALSTLLVFLYYSQFLGIEAEDDSGLRWDLLQEGFMSSFGLFLVLLSFFSFGVIVQKVSLDFGLQLHILLLINSLTETVLLNNATLQRVLVQSLEKCMILNKLKTFQQRFPLQHKL